MQQTYTDEQLEAWSDAVAECLALDESCERWDSPRYSLDHIDQDGPYFLATDGCRVVGLIVGKDGRAVVADRYTHRVGLAENPQNDDPVYTSRAIAEAQAEAMSDGNDRVYAVWDIVDRYPEIVALAWHSQVYTK